MPVTGVLQVAERGLVDAQVVLRHVSEAVASCKQCAMSLSDALW
jgi:hypothetical protein